MSLDLLQALAAERMGASRGAIEQDLDRIELLAPDIQPQEQYPAEWVLYRILGENRTISGTQLIAGTMLLADLSALAERLSQQARLPISDDLIDLKSLARQWDVHVKTIDRYRRQGLIARRVLAADGKPRLCFTPAAVARYEAVRTAELSRAALFQRIEDTDRARMIRWAGTYRRKLGWTLNRSASRIAERTKRSREAVRRVLQEAPAESVQYSEPQPLSPLEQRVIFRVMRRGGDPSALARAYRKPLGSIQRAWGLERTAQLRALQLHSATTPEATLEDSVLLSPPAISGLQIAPRLDLSEFLESARAVGAPIGVEETIRVAAYRHLIALANGRIVTLSRHFPRSSDIDTIYTALRWACRLRAVLVQSQFRLLVQNLEASLRVELASVRSPVLRELLTEAIRTVSDVVDAHAMASTPSRGRLASPVGIAINKLAAGWAKDHATDLYGKSGTRAAAKLMPGQLLADWTLNVAPWQSMIEPDARLGGALPKLDGTHAKLLSLRFGWGDGPPRTLAQCERVMGVSSIRVARMERAALQAAYREVCSKRTP